MKRAIFTTLFVVCTALPALAAELEFSAGGEVEYDDNVLRTNQDKEDDTLFRLRPGVRIHEDRGDDLNFSLGYEAPIEFSIEEGSDFDEVDHIGDGRFVYHVNDKLELFANDRYGDIRSTLRRQGLDPVALEDPLHNTDERDRIRINDASLGSIYHFSPRTTGRLVANSSFFDSSRSDRAQVWSVGGNADAQYKLTLKHQIGAGAGYSFQNFDDRVDIPGSQTDTYRVFGTWRWLITQTLAFDLNAGPAYLDTEQDDASSVRTAHRVPFVEFPGGVLISQLSTCDAVDGQPVSAFCGYNGFVADPGAGALRSDLIPVTNSNPSGQSDTSVTGFIDAVLMQRWSPTLNTALRYSRQQGDASGLGGTVIVDAVSLSNTWDFAERWQLAVRGDWTRRESAFDLAQTYDVVRASGDPGDPALPAGTAVRTGSSFNSKHNVDIDTDRWGVAARITHALFKNTTVYGQVSYDEQDSRSDSLGNASDFENFLATFGVRHVFEPIPLW